MKVNPKYLSALIEMQVITKRVNEDKIYPKIAKIFLQMGKEKVLLFDVKYGTSKDENNNLIAGYYFEALQLGKATFIPDYLIDDDSDESYVEMAKEWFAKCLDELPLDTLKN